MLVDMLRPLTYCAWNLYDSVNCVLAMIMNYLINNLIEATSKKLEHREHSLKLLRKSVHYNNNINNTIWCESLVHVLAKNRIIVY